MYAAAQDIITRYREELYALAGFMAGEEGEPGPDCLAALERALAEAAGEIDLSLRLRYALPLQSVPPVLARIAVDIAVASLPRHGAENADLIERRAAEARKLLGCIAKGEAALDCALAGQGAGGGVGFHFPESPLAGKMKDFGL